ncbi:methyl-accepting chemotaxis protein [Paenibacillus terreus]|uniref:Methyl-accepting chemotaxis protein n=1 Tax=Paenibacillus terreus TaxID=1387834 RepID=A0ABV5BHP0_9BACL
MEYVKNRIILILSMIVMLASMLVHFLHRSLNVSLHWMGHGGEATGQTALIANLFLALPVLFFLTALLLYRFRPEHAQIPLMNTLAITFGSMSMIAGGGGMVEYHFSIFMVVAIIGYYERIDLIVMMTVLFAVQHVAGYLLIGEYVYGTSDYPLSMVAIHALFLVGTSGAIIWQIAHKRKLLATLDEKEHKQIILNGMIKKLSANSNQLAEVSSRLNDNYNSSRESIKGMAAHMQEITSGACIQKKQTEESSTAIEDITSGIIHIAEASAAVSERAVDTAEEANEGNTIIQTAVRQMQWITEQMDTSSQQVKRLNQNTAEIVHIVDLIKQIASQTNLLALNAAIEAARAGEHGKGFAVVADEVRKLAEHSVASTDKITGMIQSIQEDAITSADAIEQVSREMQTGLDFVKETGEIFMRIHISINQVADQMKQISSSSGQVSASAKQVSAAVHEMASFAETTTERVQNVANASEKQLCSVEQLSSSIAALRGIAAELQELMNKTEVLK